MATSTFLIGQNSQSSKWVQIDTYWVDSSFVSTDYPDKSLKDTDASKYNDMMAKYSKKHPIFPLKSDEGYEYRLEQWVVAYRYTFPYLVDTGHPESDLERYIAGVSEWRKRHPQAIK